MAFEKESFAPNEARLFAQLPPEESSLGFGAVGHMRGEVDCSGLRHTWYADDKDLSTPEFKREYATLMLALRRGSFHDNAALRKALSASQPLDSWAKGFKVRGDLCCYYFRCEPSRTFEGYDVAMRAYDNSLLLPELAGKHALPGRCYTLLDGTIAMLTRDSRSPFCVPSDDPPDLRREVVDELNAELGVTKAQETAMRMGFRLGFDHPGAKPYLYDARGETRDFEKNHKDRGER